MFLWLQKNLPRSFSLSPLHHIMHHDSHVNNRFILLNVPTMIALYPAAQFVAPFRIGGSIRGTWPAPMAGKAGWDRPKGSCDVGSGGWPFTFLVIARTRSLACLRLYAKEESNKQIPSYLEFYSFMSQRCVSFASYKGDWGKNFMFCSSAFHTKVHNILFQDFSG